MFGFQQRHQLQLYVRPHAYSLKVSATVQQPPVLGNLCFQFHLDVEQTLILLRVVLDVSADLGELLLQPQDDGVVLLNLHVVTHLDVTEGCLQGRFLSRVKREI